MGRDAQRARKWQADKAATAADKKEIQDRIHRLKNPRPRWGVGHDPGQNGRNEASRTSFKQIKSSDDAMAEAPLSIRNFPLTGQSS